MKTRQLFVATAMIEMAAGLALALSPSLPDFLLLGPPLNTPGGIVARIAGAALLSLGVACWLARNDEQSAAARGLVVAILLYDTTAVVVLAYAGLGLSLNGLGLWPAVVLHAAMAVWCITCLRMK